MSAFTCGQVFHDLKLDLLNLSEPLPLPIDQMIELLVQVPDLEFCLQVDAIVVLRTQPVFCFLPILAHHDDRGLDRSKARKHQIQQDERIWVEDRPVRRPYIEGHPRKQDKEEPENEIPTAPEIRNKVGNTLANFSAVTAQTVQLSNTNTGDVNFAGNLAVAGQFAAATGSSYNLAIVGATNTIGGPGSFVNTGSLTLGNSATASTTIGAVMIVCDSCGWTP